MLATIATTASRSMMRFASRSVRPLARTATTLMTTMTVFTASL
jgi:hypothetical protein